MEIVTVFGASGRMGQAQVRQLLLAGYKVMNIFVSIMRHLVILMLFLKKKKLPLNMPKDLLRKFKFMMDQK